MVEGEARQWLELQQGRAWTHESRAHDRDARCVQILSPAPGSASPLLLSHLQNKPDTVLTFTELSQLNQKVNLERNRVPKAEAKQRVDMSICYPIKVTLW